MKTEQVPGEEPCSPHPEAAHIARVAHNLILSVLVATQVSFSSSPPITRVAIMCGLHITASTGFEGAPRKPQYPASCFDTFPALCRSMCYPLRRSPLWTNFHPPLRRRPAFSKRGLRGPSDALKAKYLLVPVMREAAAAQRFTFLATLCSSRS